MLISDTHRFIFIHVGKAAGTSIQRALQSLARRKTDTIWRRRLVLLGTLNRVGGLWRALEFREHVRARTVQRCVPPSFYEPAFKFAFVRNPWDALVSRYSYLLQTAEHPRHRLVKGMAGFAEYIEWELRRGKMLQADWVTDTRGRLIVDFIGRFERLETDFAEACRRLGVDASLPRVNISVHRDYRDYYTPATRDRVAAAFARDCELFGYDFNGIRGEVRHPSG